MVSSSSFEQMSTQKYLPDGTSTRYGYGLGAGNSFIGHAIVGHLGGFSGFVSEDITIPSDRVAVVLLSNSDVFSPVPIAHDIIAAIYAQPLPTVTPKALVETVSEASQARMWLGRPLSDGNAKRPPDGAVRGGPGFEAADGVSSGIAWLLSIRPLAGIWMPQDAAAG